MNLTPMARWLLSLPDDPSRLARDDWEVWYDPKLDRLMIFSYNATQSVRLYEEPSLHPNSILNDILNADYNPASDGLIRLENLGPPKPESV